MKNKFAWLMAALFLLAASVFVYLFLNAGKKSILNFDEVDYANAARLGIGKNYIESGGLSIRQFMGFTLAKKNNDTLKLRQITAGYNEEMDPLLMRHLHPPAPVYYYRFFTRPNPDAETASLHSSNIVLALLSILVLFFTMWALSPADARSACMAAALLSVFASCHLFLHSFSSLNFHIFFLPACAFYGFAFYFFIRERNIRTSLLFSFSIALLFCTLEMAFFVLAFSVLSLFLFRDKRKILFEWKNILSVISVALLFIFLIWPGALTKAALFKSVSNYVYRIFFQGNAEYAGVSYLARWKTLVLENPVLLMVVALITFFALYGRKNNKSEAIIFLLIGFLYLACMTPFMINLTYVLPGFSFILIAGAMILGENIKSSRAVWLITTAMILFFISDFAQTDFKSRLVNTIKLSRQAQDDFSEIRNRLAAAQNPYAGGAHILNYYLSTRKFKRLETYSGNDPDFFTRRSGMYVDLKPEIESNSVDLILLLKYHEYPESKMQYLEKLGFVRSELNNYVMFDKTSDQLRGL